MSDQSGRHFGLIIAYILPGFLSLAGLAALFPVVAEWLKPVQQDSFGVGPTVYALLSATAAGMIISCVRWLVLDHIHYWTGVRRPSRNDGRLPDVIKGFDYIVQNHWRYHEFAGNMLIALLFSYGLTRSLNKFPMLGIGTDLGVGLLSIVLFAASRDALAKYYRKASQLLAPVAEKEPSESHV